MNAVHCGDCVELMRTLPAASVPLVFADPPFNIGYSYDKYDDRKTPAEYLKWAGQWVSEAARLVAPGGSFWLAIGDEYAAHYKLILDATGFELRNWVIWHYGFGVHNSAESAFSRCHAHILYYTRFPHTARTWHPERVRVTSAREAVYGDKRAVSGGKIPGDVWTFSRVCGTFGERIKSADGSAHPCQMPEAVLERIIHVASEPGDVVLDPFGGSGTTAAVAQKLGRQWWTCDLSPAYVGLIRDRLAHPPVFGDDMADADLPELAESLGLTQKSEPAPTPDDEPC